MTYMQSLARTYHKPPKVRLQMMLLCVSTVAYFLEIDPFSQDDSHLPFLMSLLYNCTLCCPRDKELCTKLYGFNAKIMHYLYVNNIHTSIVYIVVIIYNKPPPHKKSHCVYSATTLVSEFFKITHF